MATIVKRPRADGSIAYLAQIKINENRKLIFKDNETFDSRAAAEKWIKRREREVKLAGPNVRYLNNKGKTLRDAIDRYIAAKGSRIGKTNLQVLNSIKKDEISDMASASISSDDLTALADRVGEGNEPSTVGVYMSHLSSVFRLAKPAWKIPLEYNEIQEAIIVLKHFGKIARSNSRERRPTVDELEKLLNYFEQRCLVLPRALPMHKLIGFALFSTRRQSEITRILRSDVDHKSARILVRDLKHPFEKQGNNVRCMMPNPCLGIINSMPKAGDVIFPYHKDSICRNFTKACEALGIDDLHFHDLRHEGISRLFEMDWSIPRVADVSGHRDWKSLKRYTHLNIVGDKYEGWEWIDRLCT